MGCTAPPGGSCQVGHSGMNAGEVIADCGGYDKTGEAHCFVTTGPSVRSADNKANFRFWSNHTGREIVSENSDNRGQPAGNRTRLVHSCGWHEQWSVVVDRQGAMFLYPSAHGLMCPTGDLTDSPAAILI